MKPILLNDGGYLQGQILISLSTETEDFFYRTVVYMVRHDEKGAFGLLVNKLHPNIDFLNLLDRLSMTHMALTVVPSVQIGGPAEEGNGFVLHSPDYDKNGSEYVNDGLKLNSNIDILQDIAVNQGPEKYKICLGSCGWSQGQLESEIQCHQWLVCPTTPHLLFDVEITQQWHTALNSISMTPDMLGTYQPFGRA